MAKQKRLTEEQAADQMMAVVMGHLETLPADEREERISAFLSHTPKASKAGRGRAKSSTAVRTRPGF